MCYKDRFVGGVEDRDTVRFICECEEVRGNRDYNDWCGCKHCRRKRREESKFKCECRVVDD